MLTKLIITLSDILKSAARMYGNRVESQIKSRNALAEADRKRQRQELHDASETHLAAVQRLRNDNARRTERITRQHKQTRTALRDRNVAAVVALSDLGKV